MGQATLLFLFIRTDSKIMTYKQLIIQVVNDLPDDTEIDIIKHKIDEEIKLFKSLEQAEREADEGKLISHDEVKSQLQSWITK